MVETAIATYALVVDDLDDSSESTGIGSCAEVRYTPDFHWSPRACCHLCVAHCVGGKGLTALFVSAKVFCITQGGLTHVLVELDELSKSTSLKILQSKRTLAISRCAILGVAFALAFRPGLIKFRRFFFLALDLITPLELLPRPTLSTAPSAGGKHSLP